MLFAHHDHSFTGFDRAVVVDVETTGSDPKNDRVLRIACLRGSIADFATKGSTHLDQFTVRLNPGILSAQGKPFPRHQRVSYHGEQNFRGYRCPAKVVYRIPSFDWP